MELKEENWMEGREGGEREVLLEGRERMIKWWGNFKKLKGRREVKNGKD